MRETLNVTPAKNGDIVITFGARPRNRGELAVLSRSMGEILIDLAMDIEVPAADIAAGRTVPTVRSASAANPRERPMVRIHSGSAVPARAFAAIRYNYTWFWIDDDDYASKRTFTLLMIFTSLAETGVVPLVPTLTLPVR